MRRRPISSLLLVVLASTLAACSALQQEQSVLPPPPIVEDQKYIGPSKVLFGGNVYAWGMTKSNTTVVRRLALHIPISTIVNARGPASPVVRLDVPTQLQTASGASRIEVTYDFGSAQQPSAFIVRFAKGEGEQAQSPAIVLVLHREKLLEKKTVVPTKKGSDPSLPKPKTAQAIFDGASQAYDVVLGF